MTYINSGPVPYIYHSEALAHLSTAEPKQAFEPPTIPHVNTYPTTPIHAPSTVVYRSEHSIPPEPEFTPGQRLRAFARIALGAAAIVGTFLLASEGKIHNPFTPERIQVETNIPGHSTVDPGHINLSDFSH